MWISIPEAVQLGFNERTIRHNLRIGRWSSRGTGARGKNGKEIREIELESLPQELQLEHLRSWKAKAAEATEAGENSIIACSDHCPSSNNPETNLLKALMRYEPSVREVFQAEAQRLAGVIERYSSIRPKRTTLD